MARESEIGWGSGCYLWDYMRRSGACGFFLTLSGGTDSAANALVVHHMCQNIYDTINEKRDGHEFILSEIQRLLNDEKFVPISARELVGKLLYTCYMKGEGSVEEDRIRARKIADELGANHFEIEVTDIVKNFETLTGQSFDINIRDGIN